MLIYDPILALENSTSPMIVIIDALDECEDKDGVLKLISIISKCPSTYKHMLVYLQKPSMIVSH